MTALEILLKKRDGQELSKQEIAFMVQGALAETIPKYQMSALLMAIFFNGMIEQEIADLTNVFIESGETLQFEKSTFKYVDKHSTGGVGDGTSLIIAPIVAACGVHVPMISGRGLGHSGGTLDKLDSIPNYSTQIPLEKFQHLVITEGYAMSGQTGRFTPADKYLYALRDVTATVESIPLITSSILSKKYAEGADSLVIDVKCGRGAFAKEYSFAKQLAQQLQKTGALLGKQITAIITRMDQPLGCMIGNFLEIEQAAALLGGYQNNAYTPHLLDDILSLSIFLSAHMLINAGVTDNLSSAKKMIDSVISNGTAWDYFCKNIKNQGGDFDKLQTMFGVYRGKQQETVVAHQSGYITVLNAYAFGVAGVHLGAGRLVDTAQIAYEVGIQLHKKEGDAVNKGDPICTIFGREQKTMASAIRLIETEGITISDTSAHKTESIIIEEIVGDVP